MEYLELTLEIIPREPWSEILVAELADLGFESFVDTENGIQAYSPDANMNVEEILSKTSLAQGDARYSFEVAIIPHQNWNAMWEADFTPVEISPKLVILAPFHDRNAYAGRSAIIIQPQMSFGTGHHQTTWLMSNYLLDMEDMPEKVLDMGTGTGVLAILVEQLGARDILAVDIEPWSVENTAENAERNGCTRIRTLTGDINVIGNEKFGLILANINKNVLKNHLPSYASLIAAGGTLLLSGFFMSDVAELAQFADTHGFNCVEIREKETWAALRLIKQ
jgi:ribosomal protein L11 methyltransferase